VISIHAIVEIFTIIRFSMVGIVETLVHVSVATAVVELMGILPTNAWVIGFVAAFSIFYVRHVKFSFAVSGHYRNYLPKSLVTALTSFLLSTATVWSSTEILGFGSRPTLIAVEILVPVCNYLLGRFLVFKPK
jgi:putative flippase GtrA